MTRYLPIASDRDRLSAARYAARRLEMAMGRIVRMRRLDRRGWRVLADSAGGIHLERPLA
jgi:hypothetical protein